MTVMTWRQLCALARALPEVVEGASYGTPALKVRGKGFVRLKEDGKTVVFVVASLDDQEALIATKPATYFITDHYRGYAAVLTHLSKLTPAQARERLDHAWRAKAPKSLLRLPQ